MKTPKLFLIFVIFVVFSNCNKNEIDKGISNPPLKGFIEGRVNFENEFGENVPISTCQVTLEGEGIVLSMEIDNNGRFKFEDLSLGTYHVSSFSLDYATCKEPIIKLTNESSSRFCEFNLKGIPNATIEMIQVDSFVDSHYVYWSASIIPVSGKAQVIRLFYGNTPDVNKDNYVYSRAGGGYIVHDNAFSGHLHYEGINVSAFANSSDSIYIAAYVAAKGYERCIGTNMGLDEYSPMADTPVIIGFKK